MKAQIALLATLVVVVVLAIGAAPYPDENGTRSPARAHRTMPSPEGVLVFERPAAANSSARNLFNYIEDRAPKVVDHAPVATPVAVTSPPPLVEEKLEPKKLDYALLGTFGPSDNPIAVFKRDGAVVNARAGDVLGDFRVEHVQFQAVNVRADGANSAQTIPNQR